MLVKSRREEDWHTRPDLNGNFKLMNHKLPALGCIITMPIHDKRDHSTEAIVLTIHMTGTAHLSALVEAKGSKREECWAESSQSMDYVEYFDVAVMHSREMFLEDGYVVKSSERLAFRGTVRMRTVEKVADNSKLVLDALRELLVPEPIL